MNLLTFLEKESTNSYHQILLMALISGIANSLLLAIVNHAAYAISHNQDLTRYFFLYLITFTLFLYAQWFAFERAILTIEDTIYKIRIRLARKVQQVELEFMEKMGSNNLYARLTQSDTLITQSIPQITAVAQISSLIIFSFLYLAYISILSFAISMLALALGILFFKSKSRFVKQSLESVKEKEANYFRSISQLVSGFKEIKINKAKAEDLLENIDEMSKETKDIKSEVGKQESRLFGFGRIFVYALLPILVFIIPNFSEDHAANIFKISATMLFITGPITILVNTLPLFSRVNMAIGDLNNLEIEMDAAFSQESTFDSSFAFKTFTDIRIQNVSFSYPNNDAAFSAGPFNEQITKGELLFIIGGNGSGKSTFLKLLTGLYYPVEGEISLDSKAVDQFNYSAYRNLFSVIFTDFYLFEKFYGIADVTEEKVNYWLEKLQMQHKVQYRDGGFTSTALSTGQRKRLGFIAAMLEDKPILVIDEFAADQDPQFRKYFYETLLLEVKSMGKTVIAVTHDDHYFHVADRVLKMDEGKLSNY